MDDVGWQQASKSSRPQNIPQGQLTLPDAYRVGFEGKEKEECVVAPLHTNGRLLGIVLADYAYNHEPVRSEVLSQLGDLLDYAASLWERWDAKRRELTPEQRRRLTALRSEALAASHEELKSGLESICKVAQDIFSADSVVIYPLADDGVTYLVDKITQVGMDSERAKKDFVVRPRQHGLFAHVNRVGKVVVPDVEQSSLVVGEAQLKQHAFIQTHGIRSFIGLALRTQTTGDPLGVLYLNVNKLHGDFTKQDEALAAELADIATLILSANRGQKKLLDLQRLQELNRLRDILEAALAPDADERKVVDALLASATELLPATGRTALLEPSLGDQIWHIHYKSCAVRTSRK